MGINIKFLKILKGCAIGIIVSILIFLIGYASEYPPIYFLTSTLSICFFIVFLFLKAPTLAAVSLMVIFWPIMFYVFILMIFDSQGDIAEKKLKVIVNKINESKTITAKYPKTITYLPKELITTRIGFLKRQINIYEIQDTSFNVGWDYNSKQVLYLGINCNFYCYTNNMKIRL